MLPVAPGRGLSRQGRRDVPDQVVARRIVGATQRLLECEGIGRTMTLENDTA